MLNIFMLDIWKHPFTLFISSFTVVEYEWVIQWDQTIV